MWRRSWEWPTPWPGGPRTGAEIAAAVGADPDSLTPDSLTRVLRGLVLDEVLAEAGGGRFALTEVGERLRGDVHGSLREGVLVTGSSTTGRGPGCWRPSGMAGRPSSRCTATGSSST
jgi:hypothetical protein